MDIEPPAEPGAPTAETPAPPEGGAEPLEAGAAPPEGGAKPLEAGTAPPEAGAAHAEATRGPKHQKPISWRRRILPWIIVIAVAVGIALVLRTFVVQTFYVPSPSMEPTLVPGDRILVQKIGYSITEGAVIVFKTPPGYRPDLCSGGPESDLVKRVIGLPGETIWSVGNSVYINGKRLSEPYLPKGLGLGRAIRRQTIPPGEYFMLGDNRPISCDSRVWGLVPRRDIVGRVFLVIWRNGHPDFHVI